MNNLQDKKNSIILVFYFQILETCNLTHVNPFLLNNFISHCLLYTWFSQDWTSDPGEHAILFQLNCRLDYIIVHLHIVRFNYCSSCSIRKEKSISVVKEGPRITKM